ncbi:MAG: hypothetical protein JWP91_406 [Fibrobacteres bacterium]|nr:hypothetical protein [Fibrobacterota bacterium]
MTGLLIALIPLMKTLKAVVLSIIALSMSTLATPIFYQFKGVVTESNVTDRQVGSEVQYVFMLDFQEFGLFYDYTGRSDPRYPTLIRAENYGPYQQRGYLAEYAGGNVIPFSEGSASSGSHYGYDNWFSGNVSSYLQTDYGSPTQNGKIGLGNTGSHAHDWKIVPSPYSLDTVHAPIWHVGQNDFYGINSNGAGDVVRSQLTLWSISMDNPAPAVPEPSTFALMGFGLIGLFTVFKKLKKV